MFSWKSISKPLLALNQRCGSVRLGSDRIQKTLGLNGIHQYVPIAIPHLLEVCSYHTLLVSPSHVLIQKNAPVKLVLKTSAT